MCRLCALCINKLYLRIYFYISSPEPASGMSCLLAKTKIAHIGIKKKCPENSMDILDMYVMYIYTLHECHVYVPCMYDACPMLYVVCTICISDNLFGYAY